MINYSENAALVDRPECRDTGLCRFERKTALKTSEGPDISKLLHQHGKVVIRDISERFTR